MFDKVIDLVIQFLEFFKFWIVVEPFEQAVVTRLGKFRKVCSSGFHWLLPFRIDFALSEHITPTVYSLGDESITTKDGRAIGFRAVITFRVKDIQKAILEVTTVEHAIVDTASGEIGCVMRASTWEEMQALDFPEKLTAACRKRGWKYGIEIISVQLAGLVLCKTLRLMQHA